jgi:hypothetical protein
MELGTVYQPAGSEVGYRVTATAASADAAPHLAAEIGQSFTGQITAWPERDSYAISYGAVTQSATPSTITSYDPGYSVTTDGQTYTAITRTVADTDAAMYFPLPTKTVDSYSYGTTSTALVNTGYSITQAVTTSSSVAIIAETTAQIQRNSIINNGSRYSSYVAKSFHTPVTTKVSTDSGLPWYIASSTNTASSAVTALASVQKWGYTTTISKSAAGVSAANVATFPYEYGNDYNIRRANVQGYQLPSAMAKTDPVGSNIDMGGIYYPFTELVRENISAPVVYTETFSTWDGVATYIYKWNGATLNVTTQAGPATALSSGTSQTVPALLGDNGVENWETTPGDFVISMARRGGYGPLTFSEKCDLWGGKRDQYTYSVGSGSATTSLATTQQSNAGSNVTCDEQHTLYATYSTTSTAQDVCILTFPRS